MPVGPRAQASGKSLLKKPPGVTGAGNYAARDTRARETQTVPRARLSKRIKNTNVEINTTPFISFPRLPLCLLAHLNAAQPRAKTRPLHVISPPIS